MRLKTLELLLTPEWTFLLTVSILFLVPFVLSTLFTGRSSRLVPHFCWSCISLMLRRFSITDLLSTVPQLSGHWRCSNLCSPPSSGACHNFVDETSQVFSAELKMESLEMRRIKLHRTEAYRIIYCLCDVNSLDLLASKVDSWTGSQGLRLAQAYSRTDVSTFVIIGWSSSGVLCLLPPWWLPPLANLSGILTGLRLRQALPLSLGVFPLCLAAHSLGFCSLDIFKV